MSYLQLADNGNPSEKYFLIPAEISGQSETKFIREDMFDDLPEYKYQQLLYALEPYQLSEDFLSSNVLSFEDVLLELPGLTGCG